MIEEKDKLDIIIAQLSDLKALPDKVNKVMEGLDSFREAEGGGRHLHFRN